MMATKNFASKDVFKKMPIRKETSVDEKIIRNVKQKICCLVRNCLNKFESIAGKLKIWWRNNNE